MPRQPMRGDLVAAAHRARKLRKLPRQQPPNQLRARYFGKLARGILADARALFARLVEPKIPQLVAAAQAARGNAVKQDADDGTELSDTFDELADQLFAKWNTDRMAQLVRPIASDAVTFSRVQLQTQLRSALSIDVVQAEPWAAPMIQQFTAENVALIKSLGRGVLDDLELQLGSDIADGVRHEEIAKTIEQRFSVGESRAKLIARDQVGKFNGDLNRVRQQDLGIHGYRWRGALDNREREEHEEREGEFFAWDDPPEDGNPGEPVNCRCYGEPDLRPLFEGLGADASVLGDDD